MADKLTPEKFMGQYWPGSMCRSDRCEFYRPKDSESGPWCWARHGIHAEGREGECPAFKAMEKRHG